MYGFEPVQVCIKYLKNITAFCCFATPHKLRPIDDTYVTAVLLLLIYNLSTAVTELRHCYAAGISFVVYAVPILLL